MAFERLQLKAATCFGRSRPDSRGREGWSAIARETVSLGWTKAAAADIDQGLAADVSRSFRSIASGEFLDLQTQIPYRARFDNAKALWFLEIPGSPKARPTDDDLAGFFGSEEFGRFARRCAQLAVAGRDAYEESVREHLEDGELLSVNEKKLDEILRNIGIGRFMDNLRGCRYGKR